MSDLFSLGLLVSVKSQLKANEFLGLEKNNFESLTHRPISDIRMSNEIQNLNTVYESLVAQEFTERSYRELVESFDNLLSIPKSKLRSVAQKYFSLNEGVKKYDSIYKQLCQ